MRMLSDLSQILLIDSSPQLCKIFPLPPPPPNKQKGEERRNVKHCNDFGKANSWRESGWNVPQEVGEHIPILSTT
jgi:hypothetical protein